MGGGLTITCQHERGKPSKLSLSAWRGGGSPNFGAEGSTLSCGGQEDDKLREVKRSSRTENKKEEENPLFYAGRGLVSESNASSAERERNFFYVSERSERKIG